ncbi:MAG: sulfatase-like hydrolase/transferase [Phycisphaeraceae bacterium]
MNFVFIITDTQCKHMVGAYGQPVYDTPNLDRLAAEGMRFERAYTASPVCTAARGALFTGRQCQASGAWANGLSPRRHVPMWGELLRERGYRAGYTGKWHLDGTPYDGLGVADGGFEAEWWYDRVNMLADLPPQMRALYRQSTTADDLRAAGFGVEHVFGHCVADRAVDFLQRVGDDPFTLVVSFDEPHDPWMAPAEYWEQFKPGDLPGRPNYAADVSDKPRLQQVWAREVAEDHQDPTWEQLVAKRLKFFGCNAYIDREIGRVIDAVDQQHGDDTVIIYTSDHGDQLGSHGLHDKGAMMYQETTNVPFIVRGPGIPQGAVSHALTSHLDILPTILDLADLEPAEGMHGRSLRPVLEDPSASVHEHLMISFNRFGIGGRGRGGFYPIRCVMDGRYKLAINMLDRDELYDLQDDPYEMTNHIDDPALAQTRNALHDALLAEMKRTQDPMDGPMWVDRPWRPAPWSYVREPMPG